MDDCGQKLIGLAIPTEAESAKNQSSKMLNRTVSFTEWMDKRSTSDTAHPPTSPITQKLVPVKIEPCELTCSPVSDSSNKEILPNNKFQSHHSTYHLEVPFSPPKQVRNAMRKPDKVPFSPPNQVRNAMKVPDKVPFSPPNQVRNATKKPDKVPFSPPNQVRNATKKPDEVPFTPPSNQMRNAMNKPGKVNLDLKQSAITLTRTHLGSKRKAIDSEQIQPNKRPVAPSSIIPNKKTVDSLVCDLCKVICSSPLNMMQHQKGRQHKLKMEYSKLEKRAEGLPRCAVCQIWCTDWRALGMHFKGQKHEAKLQESENSAKSVIMCELCHVPCLNEEQFEAHLKGKRHARGEVDRAARVTTRTKSMPYKFTDYVIG